MKLKPVNYQVREEVWFHTGNRVISRNDIKVWDQVQDHVMDQVSDRLWERTNIQIIGSK